MADPKQRQVTNIRAVENRGGARAGAGRPRGSATYGLSVKARRDLVKEVKRRLKECGDTRTVGSILADVMIDGDNREKIAAAKLYYDVVAQGVTEKHTAPAQQDGPAVYLPEEDEEGGTEAPPGKTQSG